MVNEEMVKTTVKAKKGKTFYELIDNKSDYDVKEVALCKLNGDFHELTEVVEDEGDIEAICFSSELGLKVYVRTLQFIFIKAALDIFPDSKITIEHALSKAIYGEVHKDSELTELDIQKIKYRMIELIEKDIPIKSIRTSKENAMKIFKSYNMNDKIKLLEYSDLDIVHLYDLDGRYDYFYGKMAYSTGVIRAFDVMKYEAGFILRRPQEGNLDVLPEYKEQKNIAKVFMETEKWLRILGVGEVGTLNEKLSNNEMLNVVLVSEALHEKKIANIADKISNHKDVKIILIAGPSSSGKTTFANRLSVQLRVNGVIPIPLSLDNYFVDREHTPKDENGEYDYESINALNLELLNTNLKDIMGGKETEIPIYNFRTGHKEWNGTTVKLPENGVLILEGIHGLNPALISESLSNNVFKIYISALTQLNIDNHNRISTTDVRKVRRIVRDSLSRGYGAETTLKMWPSIQRGEKRNIFVYQEEADAMFNSTLVYELGVLKPFALKELDKITEESPVYCEALRLKAFLSFFKEVHVKEVPHNSLLREFIGGSCFYEY